MEPIYLRYEEVDKAKQKKLEQKRIEQLVEIKKSSAPRIQEVKPLDPTELEDSPLKQYQRNGPKATHKRKDLYQNGVEWLEQKKVKILNKQSEVIELNFEEEENLFTPRINKRSQS